MSSDATPSSFLRPAAATTIAAIPLLLIDDDDLVREVAARILERADFEVTAFDNGEKALAFLRSNPREFAAVLLDLSMPRMDGEEVYREIRGLRPDQRVIIMSGYGEQDTRQRFNGAGVAGFLSKPFNSQALLTKVREVVAEAPRG